MTGEREPPNNWISFFRYSAWEWNEQRQEYYLHQFTIQQPDLNYRDPALVKEMKAVLTYWMEKGVSGFRADIVAAIFEIAPDENGNLPDEPLSGNCDDPVDPCYLKHIYTQDRDETYDMVYQFRETLEDFHKENGGDAPLLMTEAYTTLENQVRYYGNGVKNGSHIPFNFYVLQAIGKTSNGADHQKPIEEILNAIPAGCEANWVVSTHIFDFYFCRFFILFEINGKHLKYHLFSWEITTKNGSQVVLARNVLTCTIFY